MPSGFKPTGLNPLPQIVHPTRWVGPTGLVDGPQVRGGRGHSHHRPSQQGAYPRIAQKDDPMLTAIRKELESLVQ